MTDLPHILNWRRLNDRITTSGQPSEAQLAEIKGLGVTHVINLGPRHNKGALEDEAGTVDALGMTYIYIPVEFEDPTDKDFDDFRKALDGLQDTKVHVHCIYNARVSAFFFRYGKGNPSALAVDTKANMDSIWRPGNDWADFVGIPDATGKPNRYAGEDY
ncbi:protein tyrosine phosphatase family protein [Roseovarius rhodophyticola]|uniref:Protein tyrosine phosphatase family protein n=1 Tax=Roseovarius rhodophyticola TaxID=3080827 RepID=A0ABZ2TCA9_9RHOB|nr:protein tyrosine phosphatase family protein [Roseovarius sp. W115]MDV2931003.1 protein tyrosine phosphatase family protein [Roseovarius sp. W115]